MKTSIFKQRIVHEMGEFLVVFLFIAPFVMTLATNRILLGTSESALFVYGAALVNALVLAKIILIGELLGLGKSSENKPLIVPTLYKSLVFALLYLAFLGLESMVHGLVHGQKLSSAVGAAFVTKDDLIRGLMTFFAGIPFFALRELRRTLGAGTLRGLFLGNYRPTFRKSESESP